MIEDIYTFNQSETNSELLRLNITGITYPTKDYLIKRSLSGVWSIEYVEEGEGTIRVGDKTFKVKGGDSFLLPVGKSHYYYSSSENPWKKCFLVCSGRLINNLADGYGLLGSVCFSGLDTGKELHDIISLAKEEGDCTDKVIILLNKIMFAMRQHNLNDGRNLSLPQQMKFFIDGKTTSDFDISMLAKHISHSESRTICIFKEAFGITPYKYLLDRRISFAKELLSDTVLSVKEIAGRLCFADEYYFSGIFKKKTGLSPLKYRKTVRQNADDEDEE